MSHHISPCMHPLGALGEPATSTTVIMGLWAQATVFFILKMQLQCGCSHSYRHRRSLKTQTCTGQFLYVNKCESLSVFVGHAESLYGLKPRTHLRPGCSFLPALNGDV